MLDSETSTDKMRRMKYSLSHIRDKAMFQTVWRLAPDWIRLYENDARVNLRLMDAGFDPAEDTAFVMLRMLRGASVNEHWQTPHRVIIIGKGAGSYSVNGHRQLYRPLDVIRLRSGDFFDMQAARATYAVVVLVRPEAEEHISDEDIERELRARLQSETFKKLEI